MDDSSTISTLSLSNPDRLRLFVAGVSDYAIFMLSPEGRVGSWNTGAERIKGYAPEEIIGEHFSRFYPPEDRAAGKPERALQIAHSQGRFEDEGWRLRKDGSRFWASVVIDAIHDEDGKFIGYAKITRDITRRKQAQEALRASEERFRLLVQSVTDYAIYMLSPDGCITNWNTGAERFKGHTFEEVEGSYFSRFYTEEDRARGLPEKALRAAAEEGRFESEGWRIRKDGSRFWAHVIIDPVRNELGELIGYAKITRDITEKRETADALEKAREALFHSQKLEALGKLTGGVAHDFNNLLSVIMNGLEILGARLQDPLDLRLLDSMKRAAERGATLNQQLLTFARRQPLRQEKHDLNQVIGGFEAVLRRVFDGSVHFRLEPSKPLRKVLIDAAQFEAALLNLSSNARDAMPEGGVFSIITENVTLAEGQIAKLKEGNYVKVTVSDTGMGMTPEIIPLVIDPFFTTKPIGKGTGMGLSQVYGMMQQSGGDLRIDSTPGAGTRIQLFLPAIEDEGASSEVYASPRPDRALVVDDQPDVLMMAVELFQILGYEVQSASNGKDALDILRHDSKIDVLFTDVVMPGMNGVQLAEQALVLNPDLRVVLASGYPGTTLQECQVDPKRFQLLRKPYRTAELLRVLRQS